MPAQSRGNPVPTGLQSKSTPNLSALRALNTSATSASAGSAVLPSSSGLPLFPSTVVSEPASIGDFSLDASPPDISSHSSGSSDESDDGPPSNLPPRPLYHHQSCSHSHLGPSAFAPPFYNRPPTPLPPSPSLTSLLRPKFSSQTSRPSTPDHSSDEGTATHTGTTTGAQTPSSAAVSTLTTSFRTARPIPRASPKVPTYEYYGFTLYLTSTLTFLIYLLWSFLPSPFLHQLGIYYYPNRWWALAVPAWLVMAVLWIYIALASYNTGYLTLGMGDVGCLVDDAAQVAVVDSEGRIVRAEKTSAVTGKWEGRSGKVGHSRQNSWTKGGQTHKELDWPSLWNEGTDAVMDVPIGGVCEILYGTSRELDEEGA
ncbi:hypothetical protein LTR66_008483 [Elasticomyces elasticus]|nr:hypothetical protein LTR66_008483 [Elasticomyces elasticus]